MNNNTHVFALFYPSFHISAQDAEINITDASMVHRITRVLRLSVGDKCIIFDRFIHANLTIQAIGPRAVVCTVVSARENKQWCPRLTFFLPILRRDALASALYSLVEAGVNDIQLIVTAKVQRKFGDQKEIKRLERIIVAAAEQSKNFAFPYLHEPISFDRAVAKLQTSQSYVAMPTGNAIFPYMSTSLKQAREFMLLVGPEGDFSSKEQSLLHKSGIVPLRLTPTILRAESAAFYLAALFRSAFI